MFPLGTGASSHGVGSVHGYLRRSSYEPIGGVLSLLVGCMRGHRVPATAALLAIMGVEHGRWRQYLLGQGGRTGEVHGGEGQARVRCQ